MKILLSRNLLLGRKSVNIHARYAPARYVTTVDIYMVRSDSQYFVEHLCYGHGQSVIAPMLLITKDISLKYQPQPRPSVHFPFREDTDDSPPRILPKDILHFCPEPRKSPFQAVTSVPVLSLCGQMMKFHRDENIFINRLSAKGTD